MARGRIVARFARFARGFNNADGPYGLQEGYDNDPGGRGAEARALLNVRSRHRGNVSRRDGCIGLFDAPVGDQFIDLNVIGNDSGSFALATTDAGAIQAVDTSLTVTQIKTGLSTSAPWTFLRLPEIGAQGPAYGMNGVDTPLQTDGTLAGTAAWTAVSGTLPNGTLLEYHENTLWVAGVDSDPYGLFWCDVGDPTAWPAANLTRFNPDGGLPLTALRSVGPYLLVFKERGIWSVFNAETSANRKVADNAGTRSPKSVVSSPLGCFFLDPQQGVMLTDGQARVKRVSEQIQPLLDKITSADLPDVTGAFHAGHYYLSTRIGGVYQVLDYDTELDSWWIHSPQMLALATWDRGLGLELAAVSAVAGEAWQLFKPGELEDPDGAYESYWSGPFHTFRAPHLRKRFRQVHVDGRGEFDIYAAMDYDPTHGELAGSGQFSASGDGTFGGAGTFGGLVGTFGGGGGVGEDAVYSLGVGRSLSMTFYSSHADFWEMDAYTVLADPRTA